MINKKLKLIYQIIVMILLVIILIIGSYISVYYYTYANYSYDKHQELELDYWRCKSEIVDEMDKYISNKVKYCNLSALVMLNACDKYNIDIRLPLSQGLIESHYGTRGLAYHTNSVFNMGTFDGTPLDKILNIHKYIHPNQSIEPYLNNLRKSYLGNTKTEQDLLDNFVNLCGKRYASYDKYEKELKIIWADINSTTKLDSLLTIYQFLKVELGR